MGKRLDQHEVVQLIKMLAEELGRTPLKLEIMSRISRQSIEVNGGYGELLRLAGLPEIGHHAARNKRLLKNVSNQDLFSTNQQIDKLLDIKVPKNFKSPVVTEDILIAGDTHFPWIHEDTMEAFYEFNKQYQPKHIVQVGDLYDMYAHSKFPRSQNIYTPKDEERIARDMAEKFFARLRSDNPSARMYNLVGNHDVRPIKRTIESMPTMEHWVEKYFQELMTFEGVEFIGDYREVLTIQGVGFHHGFRTNLGEHRDNYLKNMVVGHTHRGGVSYRRIADQTLWELNAGFMGDPHAKVFSYTPTKIENYTLGFGHIDRFGPRFIHK